MTNFIKTSLLYVMLASFSCAALISAPEESIAIAPSSIITERTLIPQIIEIDKKASRLLKKKSFLQKQLGNTWINNVPFLASWYKKNRHNQDNHNTYRPCLNAIELITYKKIIAHAKNCNLNDVDADTAEDQSESENGINQQIIASIKYLFYFQDKDKQFPFRASLTHLFLQTIGLSSTKKSEDNKEKIIAKEVLACTTAMLTTTISYNHEIKNIIDQHIALLSQYFYTLDLHNQSAWSTKKITKVALATLATAATGYGIHKYDFINTVKEYFFVAPEPIYGPENKPADYHDPEEEPAAPAEPVAIPILSPPAQQPNPTQDLESLRNLCNSTPVENQNSDIVEIRDDETEIPLESAKPISERLQELPKQLQDQGQVILYALPQWINHNELTIPELLSALFPERFFPADTLLNQFLDMYRHYAVLFAPGEFSKMQASRVANDFILFFPTVLSALLHNLMTEPTLNPNIMVPVTHGTLSKYEKRAQDPILGPLNQALQNMNSTVVFNSFIDPQMISKDISGPLTEYSVRSFSPLFYGCSLVEELIKQIIQAGAPKPVSAITTLSAITTFGLNYMQNAELCNQLGLPQGPSLPFIPLSTTPALLSAARQIAPHTTASLINSGAGKIQELTQYIPEQTRPLMRDLVQYGFQGYMLQQGLQNLSSVDSRLSYVIAAIILANQYMQEHPHHKVPESLKQKCIALYEEIPQGVRDTFTKIQTKTTSIVSNIPLVNQITPQALSNTIIMARVIPDCLQPSTAVQTFITSGLSSVAGLVLYNKADQIDHTNKEEIKDALNTTSINIIKFFVTVYMLHMIMYYSTIIGL